jgi:soluble lytic murein transglycosylase
MTLSPLLRRALLASAAVALLAGAIVLGAAIEARDAWPWGQTTSEPSFDTGIHVSAPGTGGPGPGPGDLPEDGENRGENQGEYGDEQPTVTPEPALAHGQAGVLLLPNVRVAFGAAMARAGNHSAIFVYRAGVEARDAGAYLLAMQLFDAAAEDGGPLAPFATLRAAQMADLALRTDAGADATSVGAGLTPEGVADRFSALIGPGGGAGQLPSSVHAIALAEAARAFDAVGRTADALEALARIGGLPVGAFTRAEALAERARILAADGTDTDGPDGSAGWPALAVEAMQLAPSSASARAALDLLDEADAPYPGLLGALVAYRGFRNADAVERYEALLQGGTLSAEERSTAWFYLGALRERAFELQAAVDAYATSLEAAPFGTLAPDARYWRGRVLEEMGLPGEAAVEYDRLVETFPTSRFADDARVRAAVALGLAGDGAAATARLAAITTSAAPATAARAAHWHTVLVSLFDAPPAEIAPAASYDPTSYAAVFEHSGLATTGPIPASALAEHPTPVPPDRAPIDAWLEARTGLAAADAPVPADDPDVQLAWLLAAAGEDGVARGLLQTAAGRMRDHPHALVGLAIEAGRQGLHDVALTSASIVLGRFGPAERLEAPRELLALAYPVPYLRATTAAADEFGVPALLLYALMRQESAFHPTAGSSAGAFGLTQVIPPTGEAIARSLGEQDWRFADLARPEVSTRFGAYYLAVQLDQFDGNMLAALAAYNAGPGNASRWLEVQPFAGPDGYLYAVDFTETRSYLELVPANYAIYRYLYAGAPVPSLPH